MSEFLCIDTESYDANKYTPTNGRELNVRENTIEFHFIIVYMVELDILTSI